MISRILRTRCVWTLAAALLACAAHACHAAAAGPAPFADARAARATDPYRPLYHFSTPQGTLNDPHGLIEWRGNYHLFYQLAPTGSKPFHWGHAWSRDLVHWQDLPLAISPSAENDCYSGQVLVESDRVIAMYHGTKLGNCIATASDEMLTGWEKHPANPVIPITKPDADGRPYRVFDPCIWKEPDGYYAVSGTYENGARGVGKTGRLVMHLFRSPDLAKWTRLEPLIADGFWTEPGEDGAVPSFLPIGNARHLLTFFSHKRAAQYYIGTYDRASHRFVPESHGRFNFGPWVMGSLHAPTANADSAGRVNLIFNLRENRAAPKAATRTGEAAWYGAMTLPRRVWLDDNNALRTEPQANLASLRFNEAVAAPCAIPANGEVVLDGIGGKAIEIDAVFEPGQAREFGLQVLRSPDGLERTTVTVYADASGSDPRHIGIDVSQASLRDDVASRPPEIGPVLLEKGKPVRLRVFVDRSIVEVFVNDRQALSLRAYPLRDDSRGVSLFARGGAARLASLKAWQMRSIWPELEFAEGQ